MSKLTPEQHKGDFLSTLIPLQRYGTVNDIGNATLYLASDASSWVTGSILVVDGGQWLVGTGGMYSSLYLSGDKKPSKL